MAERTTSKTKAPASKTPLAKTGKASPTRETAPTKAIDKAKGAKSASKRPSAATTVAKKPRGDQPASALQTAVVRLEGRIADLKRERDSLAQELSEAKLQIAAFETARNQAINRIDWVLESLQSLAADQS